MPDTFTYPSDGVKIEVAAPQAGRMIVQFQPAPEKPAAGEPGMTAGDALLTQPAGGTPAVMVSLGKRDKINVEAFRRAGGGLIKWLVGNNVSEAQIEADALAHFGVQDAAMYLVEGLLLGGFRFNRYKSGAGEKTVPTVYITTSGNQDALKNSVKSVETVAAATNLARDWSHEPANVINPVTLAARVNDLVKSRNLKVTVIDDKALEAMGAGAIVAVGKGSDTPSRLIILEYPGKEQANPVVVIGKSITFDTGGYSLKGSDNIQGMKYDKSGAMSVLGILVAAAELGLKTPVTGVIAAAENMVSGHSYRPDDILKTLSGKTVEIISTDAEGRLVLADALTYTQKNLKPRVMIDFATLTGGVITALGYIRAGIMSNNDPLANALIRAGEETFERLWRLPLDEEYDQQIKSDDADIKNSGGRAAAPVIGGTFLKQFVDPSVPWAHIDIAGTADTEKEMPYFAKGSTGFGVRMIVNYLKDLEK